MRIFVVRREKGGDAVRSSVSSRAVGVRLALGVVVASVVLCAPVSAVAAAPAGAEGGPGARSGARDGAGRGCPVVYFDLGETLVHTADDGSTGYLPGAASYLRALRERHVRVGLITNVPSSWGASDAERAARLRKEVDATWRGSVPFAWRDFGDRVFTPRTEAERKPAAVLWQRAKAGAGRCRVVYQAETAGEVEVAGSLGYVPYQVGRPHRPAYLPVWWIELLGRRGR
ncbi:hypothetical protein ACFVYR_20380 [Streptomyces sp. NPDC058284]|uniref:hypothetical protein n=1 Tax=unclassified Streptomyces TaxID=2593676 RepID=UPI003666C4FB